MAVERTLILAKPDAVERNLAGEILARFERRGLKLRAARFVRASREVGETHYEEHKEKPFFGELVDFITSGPILAMVLEGPDAVRAARQLIGATNPLEAAPGSIRGDFAIERDSLILIVASRRLLQLRIAYYLSGCYSGRLSFALLLLFVLLHQFLKPKNFLHQQVRRGFLSGKRVAMEMWADVAGQRSHSLGSLIAECGVNFQVLEPIQTNALLKTPNHLVEEREDYKSFIGGTQVSKTLLQPVLLLNRGHTLRLSMRLARFFRIFIVFLTHRTVV